MNTVILQREAYAGAQRYAKKKNISVDEVVNNLVLTYLVNTSNHSNDKPGFRLKTESELSSVVKELIGIMPERDSDIDMNDDSRSAYLKEKYGI